MREFVWSLSALKTLFWIFFFVNDDSLYKFEANNKGCTVWKKITKNSCSQKKWNQEWAGVKRQQFCLRKQILRRWKFNKRFSGRHYYLKKSCNCLSPECCTNKSQQLPWYSDTAGSWILRKWECLSLKLPNLRKHYTLWGLGWSICLCPRNTLFGLYSILQAIPSKEPIMKFQVWRQCKQKSNFSKINTSIYDRTNINFCECCQAFLGI